MTLASACKKDEEPAVSATITFNSPETGHLYRTGDSIRISATVAATGVMHGYELKVTDTATGEVLFDHAEHAHSDTFRVQQVFVLTDSKAHVMKVDLSAEIDHTGTEKEAYVICRYEQ